MELLHVIVTHTRPHIQFHNLFWTKKYSMNVDIVPAVWDTVGFRKPGLIAVVRWKRQTRQWNDRNKPRSTTTFSLMDLFSISFGFVIYENIRTHTHTNYIIYFHKSIRMVWAHGRWSVHVLLGDYAMRAKRIGLTISLSVSAGIRYECVAGRWIGCEKWHETGVIVSSSAFVVSERVCSRVPNWCVKKDFNVLS